MDDSSGLQGRSALITGGASGIGAAITRQLAGLGVTVQIADLDLAGARSVAAETGGEAWQLDLSDPTSLSSIELEVDILSYPEDDELRGAVLKAVALDGSIPDTINAGAFAGTVTTSGSRAGCATSRRAFGTLSPSGIRRCSD